MIFIDLNILNQNYVLISANISDKVLMNTTDKIGSTTIVYRIKYQN